MDWGSAIFGLIGAVIGAAIGGAATIRAAKQQIRAAEVQKAQEAVEAVRRIVLAIKAEIGAVWDRHAEGMGVSLAAHPNGQPLLITYPVNGDYFSVYRNNTAILGALHDTDLSKAIVRLYVMMFGLVGSFQLNNMMIERYQRFNLQQQLTPHDSILADLNNLHVQMNDYATKIKASHLRIEEGVKHILPRLQAEAER